MSFLDKILKKGDTGKKKDGKKESHDHDHKVARTTPEKILTGILRGGHLTEKTSAGNARNEYTFVVERRASKPEIKKAVERRFGVSVTGVRVITLPGKERS